MSALLSWPGAVYLAKDPFPVAIHVSLAAAFIPDKILFLFITGEIIFSADRCLRSCKAVLAQIPGGRKTTQKPLPSETGDFFNQNSEDPERVL